MKAKENNPEKENPAEETTSPLKTEETVDSVNGSEEANKTEELTKQINELNDKYIRLYSEFDNYRKRTTKERIELFKTAGEDILKDLLPILDDFERAIKSNESVEDINAIKEGVKLIYNKFRNTMNSKGIEALDAIGKDFDVDLHEAITHIPAPNKGLKGKVVDEVEKGYSLHGKVIRFAKVIIGN